MAAPDGNLGSELELTKQRLQDLVDNAPIGIYQTTLGGKLVSVNTHMAEIFGYDSAEQMIAEVSDVGQHLYYDPADREQVLNQLRYQGGVSGVECRFKRRKGGLLWASVSGRTLRDDDDVELMVEGFLVDITDLKAAEENARRSEERFRRLVNNAQDAFFLFDTHGRVIDVNKAACDLLGYSRQTFLDKRLQDFLQTPSAASLLETWNSAPIPSSSLERFEFTTRDGQAIPADVNMTIFEEGEERFFLGLARDARPRQRMEDVLVQARDSAEESSRAKSQFLANMSHEIRTPLSGILGMLDLTLDTDLTDKQQEYLLMTKESARSLLHVINDILDFSKIEAGKLDIEPEEFILQDSVRRALRPIAFQCREKGLGYAALIEPNVPQRLVGDPGRLGQVLINLAGNAVKFTESGDISITVRLHKPVEPDEPVMLLFSVRDTGAGIAREQQDRLFKSFSQVDGSLSRRYGGSGLGLAICKQLVSMMGGEIWVESELGKGSEFCFTVAFRGWEYSEEHQRKDQLRLDQEQLQPPENMRILLAEDNEVNRIFISRMLQSHGHVVDAAENGQVALEMLREAAYDVVLMDIQMPVMDGQEAAEAIRVGQVPDKDVPIIALTAHAMKGDRERFIASGMNGYVSKPVEIESLLRAIAGALQSQGRKPDQEKDVAAPADSPAWESLPVLDTHALRTLFVGNEIVLKQMLMLFIQDAPLRRDAIGKGLRMGDGVSVQDALHSLVNTAGALKASRFSRLAGKMENAVRENGGPEIMEQLVRLDDELAVLVKVIKEFYAEL